jgi:hypothetical protein
MVPRPEALGRTELHHRTPFEGFVIPAVQTEITLLGAFALEISGLWTVRRRSGGPRVALGDPCRTHRVPAPEGSSFNRALEHASRPCIPADREILVFHDLRCARDRLRGREHTPSSWRSSTMAVSLGWLGAPSERRTVLRDLASRRRSRCASRGGFTELPHDQDRRNTPDAALRTPAVTHRAARVVEPLERARRAEGVERLLHPRRVGETRFQGAFRCQSPVGSPRAGAPRHPRRWR